MKKVNIFDLSSNSNKILKSINQDGYVIFRNIYTSSEINQINQIFYKDFPTECINRSDGSSILPNASHILKSFQKHVVLNKNLLVAMKKIFNNEDFFHFS